MALTYLLHHLVHAALLFTKAFIHKGFPMCGCRRSFFSLSSPHHEINRSGPLLLSTSNHFTAGHGSSKPQRDMSVKKRDEERKEEGPLKIFCLSLSSRLFLFSRRWRGRGGCCCTCSQGAVRTLTLRSPLVSPALDLLNVPISSSRAHRYDSPGPSRRAMSQTKGFVLPPLSARHCVIKPGTDQILPDPIYKGNRQGRRRVWRVWGASLMSLQTMVQLGGVTHIHTHTHAYTLMSANYCTHTHTHSYTSYCKNESGLSDRD